jgi:molybdate transport system substrate-binding protein
MKKIVSAAVLAMAFSGVTSAADITVSAAVSLKESFEAIGKLYEEKNPSDKVDFNFGASGSLLQQIKNGAPVDVFASADLKSMKDAEEANLVLDNKSTIFVKNDLVAIVPITSDKTIENLDDLKKDDFKQIALGNPDTVPAGRYTYGALKAAGIDEDIKDKLIYSQNVRQALEYVASGHVDIGFVYATDAQTQEGDKTKRVYVVDLESPVLYPIAVIANSTEKEAAQKFVDLVVSEEGQAILNKSGFANPPKAE